MTLVQYFIDFLRPYADMPEFTSCIMKALEKLKHPVGRESMYRELAKEPAESCKIYEPECKE